MKSEMSTGEKIRARIGGKKRSTSPLGENRGDWKKPRYINQYPSYTSLSIMSSLDDRYYFEDTVPAGVTRMELGFHAPCRKICIEPPQEEHVEFKLPVPKHEDPPKHPLEILPGEIWRQVFKSCEGSAREIYNTHPDFRHVDALDHFYKEGNPPTYDGLSHGKEIVDVIVHNGRIQYDRIWRHGDLVQERVYEVVPNNHDNSDPDKWNGFHRRLVYHSSFRNSEPHGLTRSFWPNDLVKSETEFFYGSIISHRQWNDDGSVVLYDADSPMLRPYSEIRAIIGNPLGGRTRHF